MSSLPMGEGTGFLPPQAWMEAPAQVGNFSCQHPCEVCPADKGAVLECQHPCGVCHPDVEPHSCVMCGTNDEVEGDTSDCGC